MCMIIVLLVFSRRNVLSAEMVQKRSKVLKVNRLSKNVLLRKSSKVKLSKAS
jgi:hypothetical protein